MMLTYEAREILRRKSTSLLLSLISKINRSKDNALANTLHEFAALYQTRPQEGWKPR